MLLGAYLFLFDISRFRIIANLLYFSLVVFLFDLFLVLFVVNVTPRLLPWPGTRSLRINF
jgi:hypothetical protein